MKIADGNKQLKVAIVHEWVVDIGGSEKVLVALRKLFPGARIFTLFHRPASLAALGIPPGEVTASFLQGIPGIDRIYRKLPMLFPAAVESLNLSGFDLVVSSSHMATKGVITRPGQVHVCYCHTPPRYLWDMSNEYLAQAGISGNLLTAPAQILLNRLRTWDCVASMRVDAFAANSTHTRERIRKYYRRDAEVVHPPVELDRFAPLPKKDYFLYAGRLVGYKRADLAIEACSAAGVRLVVTGSGPEEHALKRMAGKDVSFTGRVNDGDFAGLLAGARALLYPGEEDFGIVMVEALASGTPVIAYGRGGATDIIGAGDGVLFGEQTAEALADAIRRFIGVEAGFDPASLVASSKKFSPRCFEERFGRVVARAMKKDAP
ncbi:MAG: glycosyltransferase [Myxococcota bacterium]